MFLVFIGGFTRCSYFSGGAIMLLVYESAFDWMKKNL